MIDEGYILKIEPKTRMTSLKLLVTRIQVNEMKHNTHFPLPLIFSSALSSVSLACQNSIDVQLPNGSISPTSLFTITIADSGEGKTPVDRYFTKPIIDFEENECIKNESLSAKQKSEIRIWELEQKEIETAIKKNRKKLLSSIESNEIDSLNAQLEDLQQKLECHLSNKPKNQRQCKLIYKNTTPSKIALDLYENWPSAGLISDEAGSIFRGSAMRDLGMFNQLWDGTTLSVDRISSSSFKLNDARLTISLMVQSNILDNYLKGKGFEARDIGFIARCLVAAPSSNKGMRFPDINNQSWNHLTVFHKRITEILTEDKIEVAQGRKTRKILKYSSEAKESWQDYRNKIENELLSGRYLADVHDGASKICTNMTRIAALFHFFEKYEGDISYQSQKSAESIAEWYLLEFKRLFQSKPEIPTEYADAKLLQEFFQKWCQNNANINHIEKSKIQQYGPAPFRKDRARREYALDILHSQNKIYYAQNQKKHYIVFTPNLFQIITSPQSPLIQNRPFT